MLTRPLGYRFFDNIGKIGGAYEIKELTQNAMMKRPYQCGIVVYQLAKLQMLEFYYDILDKYFSRQDSELSWIQIRVVLHGYRFVLFTDER